MFKKFVITLLVIIGFGYWFADFMDSGNGKFAKFMDSHHNQKINPTIEFLWASLLDMGGKTQSAKYYYQRIIKKYPKTRTMPDAWSSYITIIDNENKRQEVIEEGGKFLEKFPDHEKAEIIQKKVSFNRNGF